MNTLTGIETGVSMSWRPQRAQSPASVRYILILLTLFNLMSSVLAFEPIQYSLLKYTCFLRITFQQSTNQYLSPILLKFKKKNYEYTLLSNRCTNI